MKFDWIFIVNTVISICSVLIPVALVYLHKILKALKESSDVVYAFTTALEDNKLTTEEVDLIIKEINEAKGAWTDVVASHVKR